MLPEDVAVAEEKSDILGVPVVKVVADGFRRKQEPEEEQQAELYHVRRKAEYEAAKLTFVPYFAWANRGEGEMQVFVREKYCRNSRKMLKAVIRRLSKNGRPFSYFFLLQDGH